MEKEIVGHISCSNWIPTKLTELEVVEILNLRNPQACTFKEALFTVNTNNRSEKPNSILISPAIGSWRLIMGCQLMYTTLSKNFTEALSKVEGQSFSLGIDIWCGYYFWMCSVQGSLKGYYLFSDGEIEKYSREDELDRLMVDCESEESVFKLSKSFGLDMDLISKNDLYKKAILWEFDHNPDWLTDIDI